MRRNRKNHGMKQAVAFAMALGVSLSMPMSVMAETWYLDNGSITVNARDGLQYVSQGRTQNQKENSETIITQKDASKATEHNLTINADANQTAKVTLSGVNIGAWDTAAIVTTGAGDVSVELNGNNTLNGDQEKAGLEKNNEGSLIINDEDSNGFLVANGRKGGAGIGGGLSGNGDNITINGGTITATGIDGGAGIGGGLGGNGNNITINGGIITATGEGFGAGIGGGGLGDGKDIIISGGDVTATGRHGGAGIGGGADGVGKDITISGGKVTATSIRRAAGIGGGISVYNNDKSSNIKISGSAQVTAVADENGIPIGDVRQDADQNIIKDDITPDISELLPTGSITLQSGDTSEKITGSYDPNAAAEEDPTTNVPPAEEPNLPPAEEPKNLPPTANTELPPTESNLPPAENAAVHAINVVQPSNGSICVTPAEAKPGDTVTVTVTADAGYTVAGVSVTLASGQQIPVTEIGGGAYTFTMPNEAVTITANIVPEIVPQIEVHVAEVSAAAPQWVAAETTTPEAVSQAVIPSNEENAGLEGPAEEPKEDQPEITEPAETPVEVESGDLQGEAGEPTTGPEAPIPTGSSTDNSENLPMIQ